MAGLPAVFRRGQPRFMAFDRAQGTTFEMTTLQIDMESPKKTLHPQGNLLLAGNLFL